MKVGTKSILFGVHCFFIHPIFVFIAWWKLYGLPIDPRLWIAFIVHDIGYIGKPNMDGAEGETHVELGAKVMSFLFGQKWGDFTKYHSRFYAKKDGAKPSKLCIADKYAMCLEPVWFYLIRASLSGEIHEYMNNAIKDRNSLSKYDTMNLNYSSKRAWFVSCRSYMIRWVTEHRDGKEDTWTKR